MDSYLQNQVKTLVKNNYKSLSKISNKQKLTLNYDSILKAAFLSADSLQVFQKNYIEYNLNFENTKKNMLNLSSNVIMLSSALRVLQDENIKLTKTALKQKDDTIYLKEKEKNQKTINLEKNLEKVFEYAKNTILQTEKRYTKSFGEFEDFETANKFLTKEFEEVKAFLSDLERIKNIPYRTYDNLERLYTSLESLAVECIQFTAVLMRAERFLNLNPQIKKEYKPHYIMMDGVNSSNQLFGNRPDYYSSLKQCTEVLNSKIRNSSSLNPICTFTVTMQDEVHGVVNGDINKFMALAKQIYLKENLNLRVATSQKNITNIKQTPFGIPADLYGPACIDCRNQIKNKNSLTTLEEVKNNSENQKTF